MLKVVQRNKPMLTYGWILAAGLAALMLVGLIIATTRGSVGAVSMSSAPHPIYEGERQIGNRGSNVYGNQGIAEDSLGNLYIFNDFNFSAGTGSHILKTDASGNYIDTISYPGRSAQGRVYGPSDIVIDSDDNLWISDGTTHTIQKLTSSGQHLLTIGTPMTFGTGDGGLRSPKGLALDANDNIYVADFGNNRIQKFDKNGNFLMKIGGLTAGNTNATFNQPSQIAVNNNGEIYVADHRNQRIQKFDAGGNYLRTINQGSATITCRNHPGFYEIFAMDFDQNGDLYVSSRQDFTLCNSSHLYKFTNDTYVGRVTLELGDSVGKGFDFTITNSNNLLHRTQFDLGRQEIYRTTIDGALISKFAGGGNPGDFLRGPDHIVEDKDGNIYVLTMVNRVVQKFSPSGQHIFTTSQIGTSNTLLNKIAVDSSGILYVGTRASSSGGNVVYRFSSDGTPMSQLTLTGSPTQAALNSNGIADMAFDSSDNLYVVQHSSSRLIDAFSNETGQYIKSIGVETAIGTQPQTSVRGFDIFEDKIYIAQERSTTRGSDMVRIFDLENRELGRYTIRLPSDKFDTSYRLRSASDISLDSFGNMYMLVTSQDLTDHIITLASDGRFMRSIEGNHSSYPYERVGNSTYWYSRKFTFLVSRHSNELLINGNHDYIRALTVSHIAHPPAQPQNIRTTTLGNGKMLVEWDAPNDGGSPINNYYVEMNPDGYDGWTDVAATDGDTLSATISVLNGRPDIAVKAANNAGLSTPGIAASVEAIAAYGYKESRAVEDGGYLRGFAFDADDNRYAIDQRNYRVNVYDDSGTFMRSFGDDRLSYPNSINIGPNNQLYVSDCGGSHLIYVYELDGTFVKSIGSRGTGDGQTNCPERLLFNSDGSIIVLNQWYNVQRLDSNGEFIERMFTDIDTPTGMARDKKGNFYIMNGDYTNLSVHKYDSSGTKINQFGAEGESDGQFYEFYGMIVNADNQLVINDVWNYRLQIFDEDGNWLETQGYGYSYDAGYMVFSNAEGLDVDNHGSLYIGDNYSSQNTYQVLAWAGQPQATPNLPTTPPEDDGQPAPTAPSQPRSLEYEVTTPGGIVISWQPPVSDGGSPITSYQLRYRHQDTSEWTVVDVDANTHHYMISNASRGIYEVHVLAINSVGQSPLASAALTLEEDGSITPAPIEGDPDSPVIPTPNPAPSAPGNPDSPATADKGRPTQHNLGGLARTGTNAILIAIAGLGLVVASIVLLRRA